MRALMLSAPMNQEKTCRTRSPHGASRTTRARLGLWLLLGSCCGDSLAQQASGEAGSKASASGELSEIAVIPLKPAAAETAPAENTPQPTAEALDAVVVSATRTKEPIARTPISVSVTREQQLRETNIKNIEALAARLPNAQLAVTPTNTFLFVRGLGTGGVRSAEQSVGIFVDNVFLGRPQAALFDFLDVEQVELLRGPQGALLGKNTVAGALNIKTAAVTRKPEGYLELLGGSDGQRRVRGAFSGALSESLAARVAYSQTDEDGTLFNTTQQRLDLARPGRAGRAKLQWAASDALDIGLSVQTARLRQTGDSFELSQASEQTLALYRRYDPETDTDINDWRTHTDHKASGALIEGDDLILSSKLALETGSLQFIASASQQDTVADFDLDVSPVPLLSFPSVEDYEQRSVELRYERPVSWGQFTLGAYYFQSDLDLQVDINLFANGSDGFAAPLIDNPTGLPLGSLASQTLSTLLGVAGAAPLGSGQSRHHLIQQQQSTAGFGVVRWDVVERLRLQLDGRLTRETKRGDQSIVFNGSTGRLIGEALGEEEYTLLAKRVETDFSPRASALFQATHNISSYLTVAQGFKSGGFNNLAAVPERAEFKGEQSFTTEAGLRLKSTLGISGALTVFRTRFKNLQVAALDGTEFFVGNAARARTQGVELSARWRSPFGLSVSTELGYLDAKYDRYEGAPATADSDEDSQDLSGRTLQRAPKFSGSLQVDYLTLLPWVRLPAAIGVVAEGASQQFLNIDLDPIDAQGRYVRYNAYAALSDRSQRFTLRLIGRNLTDETVRREAADIAIVGAHSVGLYPPRSLAAELGYRF